MFAAQRSAAQAAGARSAELYKSLLYVAKIFPLKYLHLDRLGGVKTTFDPTFIKLFFFPRPQGL